MIIAAESLNKMFERSNSPHGFIRYEGNCRNCNCDTKVEISKTAGGYGLQGGVLYESDTQNFLIQCKGCFNKNGAHNLKEKWG